MGLLWFAGCNVIIKIIFFYAIEAVWPYGIYMLHV